MFETFYARHVFVRHKSGYMHCELQAGIYLPKSRSVGISAYNVVYDLFVYYVHRYAERHGIDRVTLYTLYTMRADTLTASCRHCKRISADPTLQFTSSHDNIYALGMNTSLAETLSNYTALHAFIALSFSASLVSTFTTLRPLMRWGRSGMVWKIGSATLSFVFR